MARKYVRFAGFLAFLSSSAIAAWSCAGSQPTGGPGATTSEPDGSGGGSGSGSGGGGSGSSSGTSSGSGSSGGGGSGSGSGGSSSGGGSGSSSGSSAEGGACAVTSTGGIPMAGTMGNYLESPSGTTPAYGGFAYALSDSTSEGCGTGAEPKPCGTSVGCLAQGEFCGSGTTGVKDGAITYGAGIGANLGQPLDGGPAGTITVSTTGLTYTVTSVPSNSLEISIKDSTDTSYCYITTVASGTVAWASFVEKCTSSVVGAAFSGTAITAVSFDARAGATAAPYDFCVTALSF
jgi:hypothetical protein